MADVQGVSNEDNLLDEEIDALKAIFIDRISCSTNGSCVDVVYVNPDERLEIAFSIPENYPNIVPRAQVFSNATINEHGTQKLNEAASDLLGSPMLFSLISTARELSTAAMTSVKAINDTDIKPQQDDDKKKSQCKFFLQGKCRFGDCCFNLHGATKVGHSSANPGSNPDSNSFSNPPDTTNHKVASKQDKHTGSKVKDGKSVHKTDVESSAAEIGGGSEKKKSMKTATDVIHRILWDEALPTEKFSVGYLDRFVGIIEKPFTAFSWEDLASVDYNVLAVPKHRIQYFKYLDIKVWDKKDRMDKIFGSTGHTESVVDIVTNTPVPDQVDVRAPKKIASVRAAKNYDERNRPNHFLCIRVTDKTIKKKIEEVQMHIVENDERLAPVLHDSDCLHITLCMFRLETDKDKEKATAVLKLLEPILPCIVPLNSFEVHVRYVDHFRQRVVYAGISASPELLKLADLARTKLKDAGVHLCGNYDAFSPHMTFLKLTRPFSNETRINEIQAFTFDSQKNTVFGKQTVDSLRICETGPERGLDNFYITIASIQNNLLCISPKLVAVVSKHVEELMRSGILDERDGDEILEGVLSEDKGHFEKAVLSLEDFMRGKDGKSEKCFIILRGLPGSGKTFLSRRLKPKAEKSYTVCSADHYFEREGVQTSYTFAGKEIMKAHEYCRNECLDAVQAHTDVIVIDNTHSQRWEYRIYERIALLCGYKHYVVQIECNSESTRHEFVRRCKHSIKDSVHKEMLNKWESDVQAMVLQQHELKHVEDVNYIVSRKVEQLILYSALYLDDESRDKLLYHYPAAYKKVFADHMTIMFQPTMKHLATLPIGEPFRVIPNGHYCRGVQMVSVMGVDESITPTVYPHVTISTQQNIPPRDATEALESCDCATVPVEIILSGVVGVQIATGPKTSARCFDKRYVTDKYLCREDSTTGKDAGNVTKKEEKEAAIRLSDPAEEFEASLYTGPDTVKRLYIFDFDGTLYHTPDPTKGREEFKKLSGKAWPHRGWLGTAESLEYPLHVFPGPSLAEYWDHVDRACSYTVMCTGRIQRVERGVAGVLKESGLWFDRLILKPDDNTRYSRTNVVAYKKNVVTYLLKEFPNVEEVKFWDDRIDNIESIKAIGRIHPAVKFKVYHVQEEFNRDKLFKTTTYELFQRIGLRPSEGYQAAVREGIEIVKKAWMGVLGVTKYDAQLIRPFGSYLLGRRSDVDVCILAPKHNKPDVYLTLLADKLSTYGVRYVHCATGIRCPRLKVRFVYYNVAPVTFDIVMACVLDDTRNEEEMSVAELCKRCKDDKSKIAMSGLAFYEKLVKPACTRLSEPEFGMVVESILILLKRAHLKGNAFHCIRTFHVVKLLAEYLTSSNVLLADATAGSGGGGLENLKDFEKFVRHVLKYFGSLSFDYLRDTFKAFVPDVYIEPLLKCFQESSTLTVETMLFKAPRLIPNKGQYITLKLHGECPIMVWKAMSILEARVGTFVRQLIDRGLGVHPKDTAPTYLSFIVQPQEPSLGAMVKHFVNEFQKEIEGYNVLLTSDVCSC